MLNKVVSYWSLNIWSCRGNTVVHIDAQRNVVKEPGGDFKVERIAQEIRVKSSPEIPVSWKTRRQVKAEHSLVAGFD